jgi:transcriptional regulator with XRE-family HTH domain
MTERKRVKYQLPKLQEATMKNEHVFGGRLEHAIKARDIRKLYALAVLIGVDESSISRWRSGRPISTANLIKLCSALDISIDWLVTGYGRMSLLHSNCGDDRCIMIQEADDIDPPNAERIRRFLHKIGDAIVDRSKKSPVELR